MTIQRLLQSVALSGLFAISANAALITYGDRIAFNAVNPGLPVEDFEESTAPNGSYTVLTGPINSATNGGGFLPGDILPGISISDRPGPDGDGMIAGGLGLAPGTTKNVGSNTFTDSLDIDFAPGIFAVAFDFIHLSAPGALANGAVAIEIFGASGSLGVFNPTVNGTIAFFGVNSTVDAITRINLLSAVNGSEFVDNIAFAADTSVPEPSGMALGLIGGAALLAMRRASKK